MFTIDQAFIACWKDNVEWLALMHDEPSETVAFWLAVKRSMFWWARRVSRG